MASKQAACLNCRRSKIKCKRVPGAPICSKCETSGSECIIPSFHVGRQKGVKNKRTGLDKALFQIQEAIKKSQSDQLTNESTLEQLQQLLEKARHGSPEPVNSNSREDRHSNSDRDGAGQSSDNHLALDDAENPLQLLARASDLCHTAAHSVDLNTATPSSGVVFSEQHEPCDIQRFFMPIKTRLDLGPDLDPIELGLVSSEEAHLLISFFHEHLAHTRWGLDPLVHTLDFVRSRSAFLFTSLLLASSRFTDPRYMPSASAVAKRLLSHRKFLVTQIIAQRFRSVEIVLAFMVNIPWMHPLEHSADDDTGVFISLALSVALDLSLNKIIIPSWSFEQNLWKRIPKSDCIDAKRALAMDGFEDVDVESEWGQRLLRGRERAWIALYVLERGVCLARGRSYCLPITPLVEHCDTWHTNAVSDPQDGALISMAVLRRDLDGLFSVVRSRCDSYRLVDVGSEVAREIESMIDGFFNRWMCTWTAAIGEGEQKILPPYVEILVTHTRLSAYGGVINHPTAPPEVKHQFRTDAMSSALNVMRAAIQGQSRLMSLPNNTTIMVCFAACVAYRLRLPSRRESHNLAPSVKKLIEQTADVLERIGSTPSHRNGASVLYGKYLRELIKEAPSLKGISFVPSQGQHRDISRHHFIMSGDSSFSSPACSAPIMVDPISAINHQPHYDPIASSVSWEDPFQFSSMSSNQVNEAIMNAGNIDNSLFDMPLEDAAAFGWPMDLMDMNFNPLEFGSHPI